MTTTSLTPKTPSDVNLAEITVAGLSYPDFKNTDRRRGFCACCGRSGFLLNKDGRLSRHGFTRPRYYGFTTAECQGSGMKPQDTVKVAIGLLTMSIANLDAILATDLIAHSAKLFRDERATRAQRRLSSSYYHDTQRTEARGTYERDDAAKVLRGLRTIAAIGLDAVEQDSFGYSYYTPEGKAATLITRNRTELQRQRDKQQRDLDLMHKLQANVLAAAV